MAGRTGFTTRASCLLAAGGTALLCGLLLGIVDLARAGVLALAAPLLAALLVMRSRVQIANRRSADPAHAVSGQTVVIHLTISNRSLLPTGGLMLEDQLPGQLRGNARFALDGLLSRESRTVSYRMPRLPRGRYRAGPLHIRLTDPFHLVDVRRSFTATNEIVVAPIIEPLHGVDPPRSSDTGDDAGSHSIGARGADDASTREYRTGDDLRKIHWRSSARTGTLMVRQEERPWQGRVTVLGDLRLDAHATGPETDDSARDERLSSSLEWTVSAAASAATYAVLTGRDVGLITDIGGPHVLPVVGARQVAEVLAVARPAPEPNLEPLATTLATIGRESTLVAVLGDLDPHSLRALAGVHPRGGGMAAFALLLDVSTWADGPADGPPDGPHEGPPDGRRGGPTIRRAPNPRVAHAERVLRAAGWQTKVVRCGDHVGETLQTVFTTQSAATLSASGSLPPLAEIGRRG